MILPEIKIDAKFEFDGELANKVYDDLFSPGLKKAGEGLGYLIGLVPSIFMPFALINQYSNFILKKNLIKLEKKLEDIKDEDIIRVPPELGVPIMERLAYYDNDLLVDLFTELLKNAMNKNSLYKVHPRFIKIVENLSEDDALILQYLSGLEDGGKCMLPGIDVKLKIENGQSFIVLGSNLSFILKNVKLNNFNYKDLYLDNLKSLGVIDIDDSVYLTNDKLYEELIDYFKGNFVSNNSNNKIDYKKKVISVTPLGIEFLRLVFEKDKKVNNQ